MIQYYKVVSMDEKELESIKKEISSLEQELGLIYHQIEVLRDDELVLLVALRKLEEKIKS